MDLLKSDEDCVTLCVCNTATWGDKCPIEKTENNMFSRRDEIDDCLEKSGLLSEAQGQKINESSWKWNKVDDCVLYYVLLYDRDGNRIRDQETILPRRKTYFNTPRPSPAVDYIRILALFKTTEKHGFVGIYRAQGVEDVYLVVDLSRMTNTNREGENNNRRHIHFGFSCDSQVDFEDCTRIAVKRFFPGKDESKTERTKRIHNQIYLAILAGGQYTTKYLAASKIKAGRDIWIAMEGCSLGTLDVVIDKRQTFRINHENIKICFKHILLGLNDMHSKYIIHGNMTLDNMLVWRDGKRLKIAEYDEMQLCGEEDMESKIDKEIKMTAKIFYKCLKRNSKADMIADKKRICTNLAAMKHGEGIPKAWLHRLGLLANQWSTGKCDQCLIGDCDQCLISDCDAYLGAYLIMYMDMDKPETADILKHPFFWDELAVVSFITRMDGYMFRARIAERTGFWGDANACDACKTPKTNLMKPAEEYRGKSYGTRNAADNRSDVLDDEMNVLKTVLLRFRNACKKICPRLSWVETLNKRLMRRNSLRSRPASFSAMLMDIEKKEREKTYIQTDMTTFLRCIRNMHCHYMDPDVKFFDSDSDLLKFFNDVYPWMLCLLHRALWYERDNAHLPRDLRQFFATPQFLETLDVSGQ